MKLEVVASTVHGMMKLFTPQGIATVVSEKRVECQQVRAMEEKVDQKEEEQVLFNPLHPDQMITIGKKLTEMTK